MISDHELRRELNRVLPPNFFETSPARLFYLGFATATLILHIVVAVEFSKAHCNLPVYVCTLSLAVVTFPFFLFSLHEIGHGAVVRTRWIRNFCAAIAGFWIPFQPAFWIQVHGHHHRHANTEADTDRLRFFGRKEPGARFLDFRLTNPVSIPSAMFAIQIVYAYCFIGFLIGRLKYPVSRTSTACQFAIHFAALTTVLFLLGKSAVLYGVLPVWVLGSGLQNMYVITNHLTRPLSDGLFALQTGVSVHLFGHSHMGFGRHVEHHLFPGVSHKKLVSVSKYLREQHPQQFFEYALPRAVREVFRLPGFYFSRNILTDREGKIRVPIR